MIDGGYQAGLERNREGGTSPMTPSRKSPLILIVDDDPTTVRAVGGILSQAGFQTASAFDAAGALAGVRKYRPDMVLLDVSLPDGSGFDVCRELHVDGADLGTPVLFISAHEDLSMKVRGFEAGGVDYITKPVAGTEVLARVRTHLRLKQAYERLAELQADRLERLASAQHNAMPRPEELPAARFAVAIRQALAAGGDFYDVVPVGGRITDYLVADASGHDLAASYWTAALKALVGEYASPVNPPAEIVSAINRALRRILPAGAFFTLIYARLNRQNGWLTLVTAGHPPAIVVPRDAMEATVVWADGDVVGAFPDAGFSVTDLAIQAGDRLALYSDGLVEAGGTRETEIHRLAAACVNRRTLPLDRMVTPVLEEMLTGATVQDDVVLLVVEA